MGQHITWICLNCIQLYIFHSLQKVKNKNHNLEHFLKRKNLESFCIGLKCKTLVVRNSGHKFHPTHRIHLCTLYIFLNWKCILKCKSCIVLMWNKPNSIKLFSSRLSDRWRIKSWFHTLCKFHQSCRIDRKIWMIHRMWFAHLYNYMLSESNTLCYYLEL